MSTPIRYEPFITPIATDRSGRHPVLVLLELRAIRLVAERLRAGLPVSPSSVVSEVLDVVGQVIDLDAFEQSELEEGILRQVETRLARASL